MTEYTKQFNKGKQRERNPEYNKIHNRYYKLQSKLWKNKAKLGQEQKRQIIAKIKEYKRYLKSIPTLDPTDESYKRLQYVRFADDFLIGVIGSKSDAEQVKRDVGLFINQKLQMTLSDEKTLITHGHDRARFLGYDVTVYKGDYNKKTRGGYTARVNNGNIVLYMPYDKWRNRLISYKAMEISYDKRQNNKEVWTPVHRASLLRLDDLEILNQYNAEIRGLYNFYRMASNVSVLNSFRFLMKNSMIRTLANKYHMCAGGIVSKYRVGKDLAVSYRTKLGVGRAVFYNEGFCRDVLIREGDPDVIARAVADFSRCGLIKRLLAGRCEVCGVSEVSIEVHHIRRLKDLVGRKRWEIVMFGRRRKTLALCVLCHHKLHAGKLD
jgi:hypothetical protein